MRLHSDGPTATCQSSAAAARGRSLARGNLHGTTAVRPWKVFGDSSVGARSDFNGATAVRPWKGSNRRAEAPGTHRFNGATAVRPWKGCDRARIASALDRFNGATAV